MVRLDLSKSRGMLCDFISVRAVKRFLPQSPLKNAAQNAEKGLSRTCTQKKLLSVPRQRFFQHQRVHAIRVIPRPGADHAVAMPFVEGEGPGVVARRFQPDGAAT